LTQEHEAIKSKLQRKKKKKLEQEKDRLKGRPELGDTSGLAPNSPLSHSDPT